MMRLGALAVRFRVRDGAVGILCPFRSVPTFASYASINRVTHEICLRSRNSNLAGSHHFGESPRGPIRNGLRWIGCQMRITLCRAGLPVTEYFPDDEQAVARCDSSRCECVAEIVNADVR